MQRVTNVCIVFLDKLDKQYRASLAGPVTAKEVRVLSYSQVNAVKLIVRTAKRLAVIGYAAYTGDLGTCLMPVVPDTLFLR